MNSTSRDTDLGDQEWIPVSCVEVTQPLGMFYVGVVDSQALVQVTYSDRRRIATEKRDVETYLGIERPLSSKRVGQLKEYVRSVDASFPSSIIVAVEAKDTQYDEGSRTLFLRNAPYVARVLDGQHRLEGLDAFTGRFDAVVTVFVDMDIENQAMVFATINLEQTKVNRSLAYDLYDYATSRSPYKTAHQIVRLLNDFEGSPFKDKIKVLGVAGDPEETISQSVFVNALIPYLSSNAMRDQNLLKRGKSIDRAVPGDRLRLIFRDMFIDEQDEDIMRVVWNYFTAVRNKWDTYWAQPIRGFVLNRTTGFNALMQFLGPAYNHASRRGKTVPSVEDFDEIFRPVSIQGNQINPDNFPPGSGGQSKLREMLKAQTGLA